ncbi:hypothetical protein B0A48_06249 [Cryoendolithus antarcticus]|uniref:Choline monooxygenase, chloroplastic n=1 Tax=Cryoendolithus antarcticus TaxID=1507870 RepID=A0A1V8TAI6_9PEZI|nr:hypothetical protein B0A48_06249 [Cryoendolithus antarcticus]
MATAVLNYFGYGGPKTPPAVEEKKTMRALPSNWYTSKEMYELERRAIFSKKWQVITHKIRLPNAGDWLQFELAGFKIVVCKDREGNINGFHNICRHRAFPVVMENQGSSKIFACKYHGWSYGLNGKLAKAPGYQELDGFDKSKNGLLPIHIRIDAMGFIWANLDSKAVPEVAWEDDFDGIDTQERYQNFDLSTYVFDHYWEMHGPYNWKILADNYNECYHCLTTHPDIPDLADLQSYRVDTEKSKIIHDAATTDQQRKAGLFVASTYYFPNASTNISPHFFMIQRFVPDGPCSTKMQYQVFRNSTSPMSEFDKVNAIYKRVMSEDKELCTAAQANVNAGIFINGELHPRLEKGPLHFQKVCKENVTEHHKREQIAGGEIWPARQVLPETAEGGVSKEDIDFCKSLPCLSREDSGLEW